MDKPNLTNPLILQPTPENFHTWMDWMSKNIELAKKDYPEMVQLVIQKLRETPSFQIASYIERLPEQFNKDKIELAHCLPATKAKKIQFWLSLIEFLLKKPEFDNEIERQAVNNVRDELMEMENYFKIQLSSNNKKKQIETTYNWLTNRETELLNLYNRMIDGKFIAQTDFETFRAIFTGQLVGSITKLKWLEDKTLLAYFLSSIKELKRISKKDFFAKAKYCFENIEELKQTKLNYKTFNAKSNYKPKDYHLVDDLLKDL